MLWIWDATKTLKRLDANQIDSGSVSAIFGYGKSPLAHDAAWRDPEGSSLHGNGQQPTNIDFNTFL